MIYKTYKSSSNISINVTLANKKNKHIPFLVVSNNGSTFTTNDPQLQTAIERHYNFGKLFFLESTEQCGVDVTQDAPVEQKNEEPTMTTVSVADLASAKDYLAEKFNISRTMLRTKKSIIAQAEARGIVFEGLD